MHMGYYDELSGFVVTLRSGAVSEAKPLSMTTKYLPRVVLCCVISL